MTPALARFAVACAILSLSLAGCAATAQVKEGDMLFEQGDFAGAARSYGVAAQDNPENSGFQHKWKVARVFQNLEEGRRLVFEEKFLEAFQRFEEVLRLDPQNQTAPKWIEKAKTKFVSQKINEGFELLAEENFSAATDSFQRALLYDPRSENALFGLERIRAVIDRQLAKADDYLLRGVRDRAVNLVSQAAANFQKAHDLNPSDPEARLHSSEARRQLAEQKFLQAKSLEDDGHLGAALVQYRSIRAIDPNFPGLGERMGQIEVELAVRELHSKGKKLLARGEFDGARRAFEEGRKLTASSMTMKAMEEGLKEAQDREISSLYLAGRNFEQVSRFEEAAGKYEALLKLTAFYEDTIARLDLVRAAVAKASEMYERAAKVEEQGDRVTALAAFQEIFAFYPKYRDVAERIEKLKQSP